MTFLTATLVCAFLCLFLGLWDEDDDDDGNDNQNSSRISEQTLAGPSPADSCTEGGRADECP